MNTLYVDRKPFTLVGLSLRTSFDRAQQEIPPFWQRALDAKLGDLAESGAPLVAAYTECEDEFRGAYTMVIGVAVPHVLPAHASLRVLEVPGGRYARFDVQGDPAKGVVATWQHIWFAWPDRAQRAYAVDYEIHHGDRTEVFVGVR